MGSVTSVTDPKVPLPVFVPCTAGNHGRDTPKPEYKGYLHHNFDWLIYQLLQREFANDKRVTFQIDPSSGASGTAIPVICELTEGDVKQLYAKAQETAQTTGQHAI